MDLKDIIEKYKKIDIKKTMQTYFDLEERTNFVLDCKTKGITRKDIDSKKDIELTETFYTLENKLKPDHIGWPLDENKMRGYKIYKLLNKNKLEEANQYYTKNLAVYTVKSPSDVTCKDCDCKGDCKEK